MEGKNLNKTLNGNSAEVACDGEILRGFLLAMESTIMFVNEIFYSIQGETKDAGYPTVFVRLQGCNLECKWCDTKYAVEQFHDLKTPSQSYGITVKKVYDRICELSECAKVCITGGEPLVQEEALMLLITHLKRNGRYVTIETNGACDIHRIQPIVDSVVMDWKCTGSGMKDKMNEMNLKILREKDQIKFVISSEEDLTDMKSVMEEILGLSTDAPEALIGVIDTCGLEFTQKVIEFIKEMNIIQRIFGEDLDGEEYEMWEAWPMRMRFQVQLHKLVYGKNVKGV
jgi:7-carboxy-7-deazaguanine synthase